MFACMCVCVPMCVCVSVCVCVCVWVGECACVCVCVWVYLSISIIICICMCLRICTRILYAYVCGFAGANRQALALIVRLLGVHAGGGEAPRFMSNSSPAFALYLSTNALCYFY